MTITKVISYFISLAMISVILWAQNQTSLFDSIIPTLPWGIVSLVDLYSGFILIAIWMIYREKNYWCCWCYWPNKAKLWENCSHC